ncbi:DUF488 domain-containing protein [Dickeya lacustris]|uniref:DUF488 family protein n=1 Tax=Dickeya lacustris TaxID=2259638 RepID=A0ABY8G520_9GAMM|nr:DUF488 family protein [Dickeya lacustris]WFN55014.1 DUF488 family protein [Dickeya lacustris]
MNAYVQRLRVYDVAAPFLHATFLIDRLWPRGISKQRLEGVVWLKSVAPSNELRRWFHSNPEQWETFAALYRAELHQQALDQQELHQQTTWRPLVSLLQQHQPLTLLYGSRDAQHNHAVVLGDFSPSKRAFIP